MIYLAVALFVLMVVLEIVFPGYYLVTLGGIALVVTLIVMGSGKIVLAAVLFGFAILCFVGWFVPRYLFAKKK